MVNNRIQYMNKNKLINELKESVSENSKTLSVSPFPLKLIFSIIFVIFILIVLVVIFFKYVMKKFSPEDGSTTFMNAPYYLLGGEDSEIECKSGCKEGKCEVGSGECKSDDDCVLCADKKGGFYGNVPRDGMDNKIEEEDEIRMNRIRELENLISNRNAEINRLNRYIDELKKKNVEVVYVRNSAAESEES